MHEPSPEVTSLAWGSVGVAGHGVVKDAKLWPGGARAWDWNETGTHHVPGIQPADVDELLTNGAEVVVLSRGHQERLQVTDAALQRIVDAGATAEVAGTRYAVDRYNQLARGGVAVGALLHSTC